MDPSSSLSPQQSSSSNAKDISELKMEPEDQLNSSFAMPSSSPRQSTPPMPPSGQPNNVSAYSRQAQSNAPKNPGTSQLPRREIVSGAQNKEGHEGSRTQKQKSLGKISIAKLSEAPFERFDGNKELADPMREDFKEQVRFEKELSTRLLILLLEVRAWCDSRPKLEQDRAVQSIEDEGRNILEIEKQQGMSSVAAFFANSEGEPVVEEYHTPETSLMEQARQKLTQFVRNFTNAIQALAQSVDI